MRLLLDTHVYLWFLADSPRLSSGARSSIERAEVVFVSAASIWEATIKVGVGKLEGDTEWIAREIAGSGLTELPVTARHASRVARLPNIHRDPFDRLLVAQALEESVGFLTANPLLARYSDLVAVV